MLNVSKITNLRFFSKLVPPRNILEPLKHRSLIRVTGQDATDFLQGLITNDIKHLSQCSGGSMYAMFLNTRGRVLYDAIIYRTEESNTYYVECDKEASEPLEKHLKIYRVRRKVDISSLKDEYQIYTLFNVNSFQPERDETNQNHSDGIVVPCDQINRTLHEMSSSMKVYQNILIFKDPRVAELGSRIISKSQTNVKQELCEIIEIIDEPQANENYETFRYSLGVSEGINDLPPENCFPLECNCDYLHGVSFHKGCYIGQELTARTHHTGIIRKRLMPLYFSDIPTKMPVDNNILHENVKLGKLRGLTGNVGLALLRIKQALDFTKITIGNGLATVHKPHWWPIEASKEKVNLQKM